MSPNEGSLPNADADQSWAMILSQPQFVLVFLSKQLLSVCRQIVNLTDFRTVHTLHKTALELTVCLLLQFWHGLDNILFYNWQGKEERTTLI